MATDLEIRNAGFKYIPQQQYLQNPFEIPVAEQEEEDVINTTLGIPNTNAFINSGGGGGDPFNPYTAQLPGSFVTNRTNFGNTGYIQGTEPQETYRDKLGALIGRGIGMAIPGGNALMELAQNQSRENRLNTTDNAFIDQQLGIDEQNIHGFGNLENQDRYGFNKESLTGNYADKVRERVEIANQRIADGKDLRDIDNYYLEKEKELDDIEEQIEFNNFINQRIAANNIRDRMKNDPTYNENFNIHNDAGDNINTDQNQTGGDGFTGSGDFSNIDNSGKNYGPHSQGGGNKTGGHSGSGYQGRSGSHHYKKGGLASIL